MQDAVSSGGPLAAVLGFAILPLIWSVPEAMITAELTTAFPENSGYVAWVTAAFGPYWGFMVGIFLACAKSQFLAGRNVFAHCMPAEAAVLLSEGLCKVRSNTYCLNSLVPVMVGHTH